MKTIPSLIVKINVTLSRAGDYNSDHTIVEKEVKSMMTLDVDSSKRKIIDAFDNEIQVVFNDAFRLIHYSSVFTDGEQRRGREAEEKS